MQGKPITVNALAPNVFWSSSRPAYCGVSPHFDATLTARMVFPASRSSEVGSPWRVWIGASLMVMDADCCPRRADSSCQMVAAASGGCTGREGPDWFRTTTASAPITTAIATA